MALPRKLKNMNMFDDGESFHGQVASVTVPKLVRKMEEWRGGGMNVPIKIDQGMEVLSCEWTCGGFMRTVMEQFGLAKHDGVGLRFAGAYQREDSDSVDAIEIVMRGRHEEIDQGEAKPGEETEFKVVSTVSYYKLIMNGTTLIEIDAVGMVEMVNGVDRLAAQRRAIGL
ncbi:MAG: phage major tail tube protein [Pseudomonas sp.]|uniref:phage major tail tube protein n=1 Tax=Pseudomonas sp. TaxID=306 RepID=UPI00339744A0